ncbi:MAG: penicillin-binding transpeptidase domain-containing protein [Bacteroidota bacterium]|nr:penicillin-binding transpeptidase domain-containing protein [Bacteroidota bacterium]
MISTQKHIASQKFLRIKQRRSKLILLACLVVFIIISSRLIQIQVVRSTDLQLEAQSQYKQPATIPAKRGNIYDCNGNILASSAMAIKVAADCSLMDNESKNAIAKKLSKLTNINPRVYLKKFHSNKRYVCLESEIRPSYKSFLQEDKPHGVLIEEVPKRFYHYGNLAAQVLGGMHYDNYGKGGIESYFNSQLQGKDGSIIKYRDGSRRIQPVLDFPKIDPQNGNSIYLTIDFAYQSIVEEELQKGVEKFQADGAIVIMLKPSTGEVLAVAQYPSFDPSHSSQADLANQRIKALTDTYEPGSMFKIVAAAAALELDLVKLEQKFNAENGRYLYPVGKKGILITDTHPYSILTFKEAMEVSSNIVFAKINKIVGSDAFYSQARDLGFGNFTNIELPGEAKGLLKKPNQWSGTTLQAMSRGYEVGATPIQIAAAYAALANKGVLMKPYILKQIQNERGDSVASTQPTIIRRVFSEKTASQLLEIFTSVVEGERGTAKSAIINGLRIAGKTGTARKIVDGKYSQKNHLASFVGFFPIEDPQVVCLVMLDNPKTGGYTGGVTSANIFKAIAERISITKSSFNRNSETNENKLYEASDFPLVPDVCGMQPKNAVRLLEKFGLSASKIGNGISVLDQDPKPGTLVAKGAEVKLMFAKTNHADENSFYIVPNVVGLPLRRAVNRLSLEGFESTALGNGIVVSQSPEAGKSASLNANVSLICEDKKVASKL